MVSSESHDDANPANCTILPPRADVPERKVTLSARFPLAKSDDLCGSGPHLTDPSLGQTPGHDQLRQALERRVEDAEPAGQVLLHRQLFLQLGLQLQLLRVVPLLVLPSRDEGPERPPLVAVDPVHRVLAAIELEHCGKELRAESLLLQTLGDRVDRRHLILELWIADDDPRVAERVLTPLELRA